MTIETKLKSAILTAALTLSIAMQAEAETGFSTLAGIQAEPMNAAEMEATQGRFFIDPMTGNLLDVFGGVYTFDQANGVYLDGKGHAFKHAYLGADGEPYDPALSVLVDETGQSGVLLFNAYKTTFLVDGSVTDFEGNVVDNWK